MFDRDERALALSGDEKRSVGSRAGEIVTIAALMAAGGMIPHLLYQAATRPSARPAPEPDESSGWRGTFQPARNRGPLQYAGVHARQSGYYGTYYPHTELEGYDYGR